MQDYLKIQLKQTYYILVAKATLELADHGLSVSFKIQSFPTIGSSGLIRFETFPKLPAQPSSPTA